jgi:TonB family protein
MLTSTHGYLAIPPRLGTLASIVALHVLMAYLLITSFAHPAADSLPAPIDAIFVHDPVAPVAPPPPQTPHFMIPRPDYSPPPIVIDTTEPQRDSMVPTRVPQPDAGGGTAALPQDPIRLLGRNVLPNSADYYPADLRRTGVEGATTVQVCVDESGRIQGQPAIEASSGNPRLDQGAIGVARGGHYARAMRGATAVSNCYRFRIIFQMQPAR